MVGTQNLILSLILFLIVIMVSFGIFLMYHNKKTLQDLKVSINNDYAIYKDALQEQNDTLTKQLLKQISDSNSDAAKDGIEKSKNLMNIFVKLREATRENCVNTMNQIGAARIALYLFHNGTHSTHGINFIKMSCICEKVAIGSGIRERMMEHTNIPINLFDDMIDKLLKHNKYIIINNEETQLSSHKLFISAEKINYTQLVTIYDINNNLLGFVAVEMDRAYSKDAADKEKEVLDILVKQLVPVLSYSDYTTIKT